MGYPLATKIRNSMRNVLTGARIIYLRKIYGMDIGRGCKIAMTARLDKTNPSGIKIGEYTGIAMGSVILAHDFLNNRHLSTKVGSNCHIGANCVVLPGITIGNGVIASSGSIIVRDVPDNCIIAGNPARIVERNIVVGHWGIFQKTESQK